MIDNKEFTIKYLTGLFYFAERMSIYLYLYGSEATILCIGHLMQRARSLEKTLMLGKTEGRKRRG